MAVIAKLLRTAQNENDRRSGNDGDVMLLISGYVLMLIDEPLRKVS